MSMASAAPTTITDASFTDPNCHAGASSTSLNEDTTQDSTAIPHQGKPSRSHSGWPQTFRRTIRALLLSAAFLILVVVILCHTLYSLEYLSFPSFCRLPGMEVYTHTRHCRRSSRPKIVDPDIDPSILLLDGPPPRPIYWADFQGLGELQRRTAEHIFNASIYASSTSLEFLSVELDKEMSALQQLQTDAARKNYETGRALRETLYTGSQLGTRLVRLQEGARARVGSFIRLNEQVATGVGLAIEQQPKTIVEQIVASMLPRPRGFIWTWPTDMEVKWQFYFSLTSFSRNLYDSLLELDKLLRKIGKYEEALGEVRVSPVNSEREEEVAIPPPVKSDRTSLYSWWTMMPLAKGPPPSKEDEKEKDSLKKAIRDCVERLVEDTQAASGRVERAIAGLRIISQELEDIRHRIARPVAPIPLYVHLRHVYVAGERLDKIRERVHASAEAHEQEKRKRGGQ
ncbi:hypothetical protein NMY22_g5051 [Coprinellus aureogranulatus]|nr:hypothetical protein NMY22_g5051 [Coprinellus aureogranulatus]